MSDFPSDANGDALRRVASDSDMSRPMDIDFMVAVPDEEAGRAVAYAAQARGFSTSVKQDQESGNWTCYCTKSMLATYDGVLEAQAELDRIAEPHRGYSDGWGTFGNSQS